MQNIAKAYAISDAKISFVSLVDKAAKNNCCAIERHILNQFTVLKKPYGISNGRGGNSAGDNR